MNLSGLGKQVGPLPLGVWLLVGTGGLYIAYRRSNAAPAAVVPAAGDPLPTGGGDGSPSSWDGAPVVLSPVVQITPPRIEINNQLPVMVGAPVIAPAPIKAPAAPPRVPVPVKAAPKPAPAPVHHGQPWNGVYYRQGSRGAQVGDIQSKVGAKVDQQYGPLTAAAVRTFQLRHGLVPDGVVGPLTWAKLYT